MTQPGAADLLRAAREALSDEVLPNLQDAPRYAALMVANALRMVERELAMNGSLEAAEQGVREIAKVRSCDGQEDLRSLCDAIRRGHHDGDEGLHAALYARSIAAVAITRPES